MGVDRVAKARRLALQAVLNLDVHLAVGVIFDIENRADGEGVARRAVVPKICSYLDHTGTCGLADALLAGQRAGDSELGQTGLFGNDSEGDFTHPGLMVLPQCDGFWSTF